MLRFHAQLGFDLRRPQLKKLRNALILHGNAVKHIGFLHGAPAVGDDDKLVLSFILRRYEANRVTFTSSSAASISSSTQNGAGLTFIMEK